MSRLGVFVIATALVAGCAAEPSSPTAPLNVPVFSQSGTGSPSTSSPAAHNSAANANANGGNFGTPLSAGEEVMPAGITNESQARGSAVFQLNAAGTEVSYQLIVANIENVFQAHIHRAAAGVNGPIVVWL